MGQTIVVPSGDRLEFPDGMADADIEKVIFAEYPDLAPKAPKATKVGTQEVAPAEIPSTADTINAPWTSAFIPKDETISLKSSVMDGRPVSQITTDQAAVDTLGAPVTREFQNRVRRQMDAMTPEQRQAMAELPDMRGRVAKEMLRQYQALDASAQSFAGNRAPTVKGIDTRREQRATELSRQGVHEDYIDTLATNEAMQGGDKIRQSVSASDFDFEAQDPGLRRAWRDWESGVVGSTGATLAYAGRKSGVQALADIGDSMDKWAKGKMPANPTFADELVAAFGSSGSFLIPGIGVARGAEALAILSKTAAKWAGAGTMAALEAAAESDGVYKELVQRGVSEQDAMDKADGVFWKNMAVLGVTDKIAFFNDMKAAKTALGRFGQQARVAAPTESTQEGAQQVISNEATDKPLAEGVPSSMAIGGIVGGVSGGIHGAMQPQRAAGDRLAQRLYQNVEGAQFDPGQIDAAVRQSLSPDAAQLRRVSPVPTTPPVPPAPSARAELEAVLNDKRPVEEILAETQNQQAEASGWPALNTPVVAKLPDGQVIAGQIQRVDNGAARFVARDGEVWVFNPGEAEITAASGDGTRAAPVKAETADDVKLAEQAVDTAPTEAQKQAGNYRLGHLQLQGMDIAIETPAGATRAGVDRAGKPWSVTMNHTYGYIKGAEAKDGDKLDAFIGPNPQSPAVYVIDQIDPKTGNYDEAKVMLGFSSADEARAAYLSNYEQGWQGLGAMTPMHVDAFKAWIAKGDTRKALAYTKPAAPVQTADTLPRPPQPGPDAAGLISKADAAPAVPQQLPKESQDGQGQETRLLSQPEPAPVEPQSAGAEEERRLQAQYQSAVTESNDPRLTDGERKIAAARADEILNTMGGAKSVSRTKNGKLEVSGFDREDVAESLKTAKIKATIAVGQDGKILVSMVGRDGNHMPMPAKQANAVRDALLGKSAKPARKRGLTGNLRNDVNIIAPGLYAEVARGGDGEGLAGPTIAGTPTIVMSDKGLQQIAASNQPAAEKARAELEARDQADEVDLGALFDEVLAEETGQADNTATSNRLKLLRYAKNIGVQVMESVGRFHASDGMVEIPYEDSLVDGAQSADHVLAHELGHAAMQNRGISYSGFPAAELRKQISNWDELIAASRNFRPGVWDHSTKRIADHARKPNEIISDAIASVLIGENDFSLLRGLPLTERDIGITGEPKTPAQPRTAGQEIARVEQPQHIEAGQAEPATAPVIAASIKESAKNTPMNIEQAREWLLSEIDKAIIDAKSAKEEGIWNRADDKVNLEGIMDVGATIGFKTFNVPGDGKFRILNLKESLQKFKKQVAATPGFKKNATRPMSVANGSGGKTSVRDMLDDGEYVLAVDYGHLTGKPLLFGAAIGNNAHPVAYTDAEPVDIKGVDAQVGREWNQTGKSFMWRVIETTTGASVSSESTKEKAISKALAHVDEHGTDKLIAQINETPKVSQAELERQFTDWGSQEEAVAQKKRDAVERADSEDRALWNSIWPLKDGEKRSPNPWNDIDHLQVVILAKDAVKEGKGDEFVSLIERRRGGTNNVLALAARKALAEAGKTEKQSGGVDYKGFARTPTGNGNFTLKDGNLLVKVEAMGGGKFQASHGSAKSSPHINSEQGAVDWAANLRDASKKTTAYPFYSNNKLFNAEGTAELPKDWTGVARSDSGKRFFYLGQENGERSFNPLKAESYEDALKEAEGLKNDKPVVPDGYREVARGYFGGTVEKPIYAPFSEGERVRFIGGHAGNIQSFIGGPVTTGAIIKYDNGLTGHAEWRDVEAIKKPDAEQEPKNFKSIDTLNAANNPLGEDDWIRFADGSEWQVKGRMNGWVLMHGKTEHPTVKNIMGQVPLIRAVIEANDAAQNLKEVATATPKQLEMKARAEAKVTPKQKEMKARAEGKTDAQAGGEAAKDGLSSLEKDLAEKSHDTESSGDVGVVVGGGKVKYVSLSDAVDAAKKALAAGTKAVPFQVHNATGIRIGDVERVLAEVEKPSAGESAPVDDSLPAGSFLAKPEELDADKIKAGYAHRSHSLSDKVTMERKWYVDAVQTFYDTLLPLARNDAQKAKLEQLTRAFRDEYRERRYRVLDIGSSTYSAAIAGPSNFNRKQSERRFSSLDKAEKAFNDWATVQDDAAKPALLALRTEEERAGDDKAAESARIKKLVRPVLEDLAMIGAIDTGEAPGMSRPAFVNGAQRKISNLSSAGETEALRRIFSQIEKWDAAHDKPLFAAKNSVWQFKPAEQSAVAAEPSAQPSPEAEQTPSPTEADRVPQKPAGFIPAHKDLFERLRDGKATLDEYKTGFATLLANKDAVMAELGAMTKEQLLEFAGGRYKNDKKADVIRGAWYGLTGDFQIGRGLSYGMGKDAHDNALRAMVERTTQDDIDKYAAAVKAQRDEYSSRLKQMVEAAKDPKTLDDFTDFIRMQKADGLTFAEARMKLTPEQRAEFDRLRAIKSRDERKARADQQKTDVRVAATTAEGQIVETKHTKTGEPLFVVKAAERVERDVYNHWNATAKRLGGWYSSYRGGGAVPGFQFKTRENADAFLAFIGGNAEQAQEAVQARRDAFEDDRSQSAVERLNEMADRLDERADESLGRERKANTERRARFAASAEAAANAEKAMATTMRRIAAAISDGTAQFLDRVRQKAQIEYLTSVLRTAKDNEARAEDPNNWYTRELNRKPVTAATADYAEFPQYTMMRSDLANLARRMVTLPNMKMLGQRILKVADDTSEVYNKFAKEHLLEVSRFGRADGSGWANFTTLKDAERSIEFSKLDAVAVPLQIKRGEYRIVLSPSEAIKRGIWEGDDRKITLDPDIGAEIVEKLGKLNRASKFNRATADRNPEAPWQFENAYNDRKRLAAMGIEEPWEFRAALREFAGLKESPKERDKIKEMERAMIGRRKDGLDFFPTSAAVVEQMLAAAEIEEGMSVLEPSAGMGHIADGIREAGVDPDVVELSGDRRELLEAKGFNVVGNDFMDMSPRGFTYGDVFQHKDGRKGVMRGSGGMGSGRVGFAPLDENGTPDMRNWTWEDRDDLTGIEKRGHASGYDRILMNPPFSDRRDAEHVQHAYTLLRPGGRLVAVVGEGVFFGNDKKAQAFRDWLEEVGATDEKLPEGSFMDPALPVNTGVNARLVVIDKPEGAGAQEFNSIEPLNDLSADQSAAISRAIDRAIAMEQGKDVAPIKQQRVRNRLAKLRADLEAEKIDEAWFIAEVERLHAQMELAYQAKQLAPHQPRARGADWIRQKLLEAKRRGDISEQAADMAEWFILKNPALVDDLGISIRERREGQASGNYTPMNRVFTLFKGEASDTTTIHEILHHLERMMPADMQAEIRREWLKQATKELTKAQKAGDQRRVDYFMAALAGDQKAATKILTSGNMDVGRDYRYLNASEFWAVSMTETVADRFKAKESIWARSLQWLREALEHIKAVLGLNSRHPLIKALNDIDKGTGEFVSKDMLGSSDLYASIEPINPVIEEVVGPVLRDISLPARLLLHPRQVAANHKEFAPVFDTAIRQYEERDSIVSKLGDLSKAYFDLGNAKKVRVGKIIEQGRLDRMTYTREDLENGIHHHGGDLIQLDDSEIAAYFSLRNAFDEALTLFRNTMLEEYGFPELVGEERAALRLAQMIAGGEIEEKRLEWAKKVAVAINEIEQAKRTGYAPFTRYGQFVVAVKALPRGVDVVEDDDLVLVRGVPESAEEGTPEARLVEIVTDLSGQFDDARGAWIVPVSRNQAVRALEKTLYATKVEVGSIKEWRSRGQDVTEIPEVKAAFDAAKAKYGNVQNSRIIAFHISEKEKARDANITAIDELAKIAAVDTETWDEVRAKLQDAIKSRGFRRHFFGSDNTPGYSTDFERSIADYIIGMSGYLARRKHVKEFDDAITRIKAPKLAAYADEYRQYVNSPADEFALVKQIGFLSYIAGTVATAATNLTQVPMLTVPTLAQFVPYHVAVRETARAWKDALAMFSPTATGLQMFDPAKVPADVGEAFMAAWNDQLFVPLETLDLMATASVKTVGGRTTMRVLNQTTQAIAYLFMFAERINRITTFIAAQRISRMPVAKQNMQRVTAGDAWAKFSIGGRKWNERSFAEWVVDESQYRMGKVNRPKLSRGVGSPLLQFKGYMMQTLEAGYRMAAMHGPRGQASFLAAIAMMLMLGGLWGLPGLEDLRDIIEKFYKVATGKDLDLKTETRRIAAEMTGSATVGSAVAKGVPYATIGVDMSRVGMGNIIPDSPLQVFGIPADMAIGRPMRAAERAAAGNYYGAMTEMLPNFLKNPAVGLQWKFDGLRDRFGSRLMTPGEFDYGDVAIKSLGWTPTKVTNRRDYTYAESRAESGINELKRRYTNDLVRAYVREQQATTGAERKQYLEEQKAVLEAIAKHNAKASQEQMIKLDPDTLRKKAAAELLGGKAREGKERKFSRDAAQQRRELFQVP